MKSRSHSSYTTPRAPPPREGRWTLRNGKDDMIKFRLNLESHKSVQKLALEMVTRTIVRDIKEDTAEIRHYTALLPDIKNDNTQTSEVTLRLRARLPIEHNHGSTNIVLQRLLNESTGYAETVVNEDSVSELGTVSELSELIGSSAVPTLERSEDLHSPVSDTDYAFYALDRVCRSRPPSPCQTPNPAVQSTRTPSPGVRPYRILQIACYRQQFQCPVRGQTSSSTATLRNTTTSRCR
jgi:hypothetical protein